MALSNNSIGQYRPSLDRILLKLDHIITATPRRKKNNNRKARSANGRMTSVWWPGVARDLLGSVSSDQSTVNLGPSTSPFIAGQLTKVPRRVLHLGLFLFFKHSRLK